MDAKEDPLYPALRNRPWTKEEEDKLRELWENGTAVSLISRILGRRSSGVGQKAKRLGLGTRYRYNPYVKAKERAPTKKKKCLKCQKPFQATRFIFLCKQCKRNIARVWSG
tara:strand:- start:1095 stop:1427 length:333 start_codon:yes stop_codon:yes gene_type:complete